MKNITRRGIPIILSGPSGSGKDTLRKRFIERHPDIFHSVSATTRPRRDGEGDGHDYHFTSREEFERGIEQGHFVEWAEYVGNLYGTPREPLEKALDAGRDVLLVIEVQGAQQVKRIFPEGLFVFVLPPSWEEMEVRLRKRGSEDPERIKVRLRRAEDEIELLDEFEYVIINDELDQAVDALETIREAARFHRTRVTGALVRMGLLKEGRHKAD